MAYKKTIACNFSKPSTTNFEAKKPFNLLSLERDNGDAVGGFPPV